MNRYYRFEIWRLKRQYKKRGIDFRYTREEIEQFKATAIKHGLENNEVYKDVFEQDAKYKAELDSKED